MRYALKTSQITNFRLPPVEKRSRDSSLGPLEPWNFFLELANRILVTRSKNHMHIKCLFFHEKILPQDGWKSQLPITVKERDERKNTAKKFSLLNNEVSA